LIFDGVNVSLGSEIGGSGRATNGVVATGYVVKSRGVAEFSARELLVSHIGKLVDTVNRGGLARINLLDFLEVLGENGESEVVLLLGAIGSSELGDEVDELVLDRVHGLVGGSSRADEGSDSKFH